MNVAEDRQTGIATSSSTISMNRAWSAVSACAAVTLTDAVTSVLPHVEISSVQSAGRLDTDSAVGKFLRNRSVTSR
jgi:hypothetical protein